MDGQYSLETIKKGIRLVGCIERDVPAFFLHHDCPATAAHCARVAAEAKRLAQRFGSDPRAAEVAGWLHDISTVIPNGERTTVAREWGIDVLPEEDRVPMIVHQKLSLVLARDVFGVSDTSVLEAIECHTTLRAHASVLDKTIFIADKIKWDQVGEPPYIRELLDALEDSLDTAVAYFLRYLWDRRSNLLVIHPWLVDACRDVGIATDMQEVL